MHSRKFKQPGKLGTLKLSRGFREIIISVDLIHGVRVEFAEKI